MAMKTVVAAFAAVLTFSAAADRNCNLILRDMPGKGLGVFAGKDWLPEQRMELAIGIPVPYEGIYWTKLIDYCEGYNDTHALLTLGYSMLYNHIPHSEQTMIQKHMSNNDGVVKFSNSHERSTDVFFEPNSVIFAGDQIYSHYGEDWFVDRGIDELEGDPAANSVTLDRETSEQDVAAAQNHPFNLPGCAQQMTYFKRGVLYAAVNIAAGEHIEVVRALLLPHWAVAHAGAMGEFLWRKYQGASEVLAVDVSGGGSAASSSAPAKAVPSTQELYAKFGSPYTVTPYNRTNAGYAVLLTGRGALYSTSGIIGGTDDGAAKVPNVQYDWWGTADNSTGETGCSLTMLVSFRALRYIAKGEELVVELSVDTQTGFKFARPVFTDFCL